PPAGLQPAPAVLVFNDRIASHAGALADSPELVRLTQPIDIERFRPRDAARPRARRVLLLSNYLDGARLQMLEGVCDELGLELARIGATGTPVASPQEAIADADIVVGYGRSVLEGMAMGRAAYVWDYAGGDGWVTPESYAAHEADGFSGAGSEAVIDAARLRADLAAYSPELGEFGWDLVRLHHSAAKHAERLVDVMEAASAPRPEAAASELARLVRLRSRAEIRVDGLETENKRMREALEAQHQRAEALEAQLGTVLRSRSWRLLELPRRLAAKLRERLLKGGPQ
ncbi:MAG TPA: hypothetical protein VFB52_14520, partial [Solirubrobacterales bacterium]|nr:hypothetical protein [Solirubrobacterales bacterium]